MLDNKIFNICGLNGSETQAHMGMLFQNTSPEQFPNLWNLWWNNHIVTPEGNIIGKADFAHDVHPNVAFVEMTPKEQEIVLLFMKARKIWEDTFREPFKSYNYVGYYGSASISSLLAGEPVSIGRSFIPSFGCNPEWKEVASIKLVM